MIVSSAASTVRSNCQPAITKIPAVISMSWNERDDGARREARAEAEADVDEDQQRGDAERVERVAAQIAPHARAHELDALDLERADGVGERELQPLDLGVRAVVAPPRRACAPPPAASGPRR